MSLLIFVLVEEGGGGVYLVRGYIGCLGFLKRIGKWRVFIDLILS